MLNLKDIKVKLPTLNLSLKKKELLGVEIDSDYIRVAVLREDGEDLILEPAPFEIKNIDDIAQSIKRNLELKDIKAKDAVFSLPISATLYKSIKLPKVSDKELQDAVEWNIREDIKTLKGKTFYDYDVLNEEGDFLNVIVVIAKVDDLERLENIASQAGLNLKIIDSAAISLLNLALLQRDKYYPQEKNLSVLHIDENESNLLFSNNNLIIQPLDFNIKHYKDLSPDEKEEEVLRLINEINYFFLTITEPKIIFVSGLVGKYVEIREYMQFKFGQRFTVVDLDPRLSLNIKVDKDIPITVYNIPISLAYRGLTDDKD
ncbi:hypothetical protein JCM14244_04300 [Venenivibrio stagnispumantis]|uniref:Type IV pilus assembly protein PilM n=1 Tax=Venenivibrio stagnispumantis TaxID=407998 RepID=A0AA46ADF1_9AQUI|nr:pilus assembly protein PilM [Venenivibrio stagnispumantis]MCW4572932.1 pilus assembly protein PilM [Venenivibrio stagnispumantis]SMP04722.1 type IV pilus assembly protein PilM [Venenivibrio stagnispumantis]